MHVPELRKVLAQRLPLGRVDGARHYCIDSASTIFSTCPPNCLRMADCNLFAYVALPCDENRVNSDAVRTCAGTPISTAACTVQRPSPESDTRPLNSCSPGHATRACAVRSSNHEPTTDPRRHTSATSGTLMSNL